MTSAQSGGSISVGSEDQCGEREMERKQRREDDGIGVPAEANPHAQLNDMKATPPASEDEPEHGTEKNPEPWEGRADKTGQPGQTPEGGLGGSGPVQP